MIIWHFTNIGIEIAVGAYHPDRVLATVTIPFRELQQIVDNYQEFERTRKNKMELLIEKAPPPDD